MDPRHDALRLAETAHLGYRVGWQRSASAELRRQHAEIEWLRDERDKTIEARKAAQLRVADLQAEVSRLEPMRQRAADIERLTAERDALRAEVERITKAGLALKEQEHGPTT